MAKYLAKRFCQSLIAVLGITLVVFLVLNVAGDPVELMLPPSASRADMELLREEMGFNDPIMIQYGRFLKGAIAGDFGMSYNYNEPAMKVVVERIPATVTLAVAAFVIAMVLGIPAGIISAIKRNTKTDMIIRSMALLGQCIPAFWLGIMLMMIFSVKLKWLPTSGYDSFKSLLMPAFTLGVFTAATIARLLRSNMLEIMTKEYIDVAKAKGLSGFMVVMKHAFKNAFSSILTVLGLQIASLIGGAVIVETVFGWPGIGRLVVQSITNSDFMVVEAIVFIMAISFTLVNFIVDILYCIINPRIKMQ
ncbi:ABC transporter permease [Lutispora saccharofermentans]|uniref:ABC transporter permease n=1 Tax=Lutispora saccharofermentans TaxID=3024236 RepID=A0ABT1NP73_9FIRM|nr:ABC transporter permease [Lutispora saccharofermentans]MCQ1531751.1 ABC transporter permease [Lutispora saccharofermentans]